MVSQSKEQLVAKMNDVIRSRQESTLIGLIGPYSPCYVGISIRIQRMKADAPRKDAFLGTRAEAPIWRLARGYRSEGSDEDCGRVA